MTNLFYIFLFYVKKNVLPKFIKHVNPNEDITSNFTLENRIVHY